jgi:hypothetical protein
MSHFDVKIQTSETKLDHLRMYYCDFLTPSRKLEPPILTEDQRTLEVESMCEWLLRASPRNRFEAYPLWIITKDMLRRFVSRDITLLDRNAQAQQAQIRQLSETLAASDSALRLAEQRLLTFRSEADKLDALSRDLADWQGRAAALQLDVERANTAAARAGQLLERQEAELARRMEARVLEVKAKVEAIWSTTVEEQRTQAARASADAATERGRRDEAQALLRDAEAELAAARADLDAARRREADLDAARAAAERRAARRFGPDELAVLPPADAVVLLQALLTAPAVAAHLRAAKDIPPAPTDPEEWTAFRAQVAAATASLQAEPGMDDAAAAPGDSGAGEPTLLHLLLHMAADRQPPPPKQHPPPPTATEAGAEELAEYLGQLGQKQAENEALRAEIDRLLLLLETRFREPAAAADVAAMPEGAAVADVANDPEAAAARPPPPPAEFRPLCLRAYDVDERLLKGKAAKPLPAAGLLVLMATAYEAKARADAADDRKGNRRQSFPEFLRDFFLHKCGEGGGGRWTDRELRAGVLRTSNGR